MTDTIIDKAQLRTSFKSLQKKEYPWCCVKCGKLTYHPWIESGCEFPWKKSKEQDHLTFRRGKGKPFILYLGIPLFWLKVSCRFCPHSRDLQLSEPNEKNTCLKTHFCCSECHKRERIHIKQCPSCTAFYSFRHWKQCPFCQFN